MMDNRIVIDHSIAVSKENRKSQIKQYFKPNAVFVFKLIWIPKSLNLKKKLILCFKCLDKY